MMQPCHQPEDRKLINKAFREYKRSEGLTIYSMRITPSDVQYTYDNGGEECGTSVDFDTLSRKSDIDLSHLF